MNQTRSKQKTNNKTKFLIPIIAVLGFVPLIVHMRQYDAGMEKYDWFPDKSNIRVDIFMAYKSYAIMLLAGIMLLVLIVQTIKGQKQFRMETSYYLLLIYAIFVIMSGLFSIYKPQVFTGSYEIFQPVEVIIGYLLICFYTYQYADSSEKIKKILLISSIGLGIILIIGISQFIGYDLLQTTVGRLLISDVYHIDKLDTIDFNMQKHRVYATLYNPDFLSFYFGLITPVIMAAFMVVKKKWQKVILGIVFAGCIICLIGADVSAGYLAFGIAIVVGVFILLSRKKTTFIATLIVALFAIIIGVIVCIATPLGTHVKQLFFGTQRSIDTRLIKSIETTDDDIVFNLEKQNIHISYEIDSENGQMNVNFIDADGNQIPAEIVSTENGAEYVLQGSDLGNCSVEPVLIDDELAICVNMDQIEWYFSKQADGTYYYYNPFGKWEKISEVKKARIFNDDAMSNRGTIWDLTIPLLGKHVIMGSGSNTYGLTLPQNDYVYKEYAGTPNVLIAKAHNWFLQEWVENGLIATLCLFGFYIWYFIRSVKIYRHCDIKQSMDKIGFGIFVGTIGYVAAGIASDSNICTAPVFWVFMGLGMSINSILIEKEKNLMPTIVVETEKEDDTVKPITPVPSKQKKLSRKKRKSKN